jgi:hypothetical protein
VTNAKEINELMQGQTKEHEDKQTNTMTNKPMHRQMNQHERTTQTKGQMRKQMNQHKRTMQKNG